MTAKPPMESSSSLSADILWELAGMVVFGQGGAVAVTLCLAGLLTGELFAGCCIDSITSSVSSASASVSVGGALVLKWQEVFDFQSWSQGS